MASDSTSLFTYAYDGSGNRYQQSADGALTTYTLDLAGGLSEVLYDGSAVYSYGLERLAQQVNDGGREYFLSDALGSVRQLTDAGGAVIYGQSFDPFGSPITQVGTGGSAYGYAGQWTDLSGLQHLRARYYAPGQGRFLSRDPFAGFLSQPATLNPYVYAANNPVLMSDPSGYFPIPDDPIQIIRDAVVFLESMGHTIVGDPTIKSINANGTDIVSQTFDDLGNVTCTFLTEVKQTAKVTLSTLGKDTMQNYGGSIERSLRTADRLAKTSNEQLKLEFQAILKGDAAGNLKNVLYTTANHISKGAQNIFNYVYIAAANGAVTTVKAIETFTINTIKLPVFMVLDFRNAELHAKRRLYLNNQNSRPKRTLRACRSPI